MTGYLRKTSPKADMCCWTTFLEPVGAYVKLASEEQVAFSTSQTPSIAVTQQITTSFLVNMFPPYCRTHSNIISITPTLRTATCRTV